MSALKTCHGACHCGAVQYRVKLALPPPATPPPKKSDAVQLYKCNCSTCHKMGIFHCRPTAPADNFILTSPSSIDQLGDYRVFSKNVGWYFCPTCGVRVFGLGGQWEQAEVDVGAWSGGEGAADGEKSKVWVTRPHPTWVKKMVEDGKEVEVPMHYLSVNAVTLEGGEAGVDLREWHEKGWLCYYDSRELKGGESKTPHPMGMY